MVNQSWMNDILSGAQDILDALREYNKRKQPNGVWTRSLDDFFDEVYAYTWKSRDEWIRAEFFGQLSFSGVPQNIIDTYWPLIDRDKMFTQLMMDNIVFLEPDGRCHVCYDSDD